MQFSAIVSMALMATTNVLAIAVPEPHHHMYVLKEHNDYPMIKDPEWRIIEGAACTTTVDLCAPGLLCKEIIAPFGTCSEPNDQPNFSLLQPGGLASPPASDYSTYTGNGISSDMSTWEDGISYSKVFKAAKDCLHFGSPCAGAEGGNCCGNCVGKTIPFTSVVVGLCGFDPK